MRQVKFEVRRKALFLGEFTAADIIDATALNPESVRTELQRMREEGLITSHSGVSRRRKRGRPPTLYRLTNDPEARLALSESLDEFYPPRPSPDRPSSRHYLSAKQLLDWVQGESDKESHELDNLLVEAEQELEFAEHTEGGKFATEQVNAYLKFEGARLLYLRNELEDAEHAFLPLRQYFAALPDETMVRRIDEFLLAIRVQRQVDLNEDEETDPALLTDKLNKELEEGDYQIDSPLLSLLLRHARQLLHRLRESTHFRRQLQPAIADPAYRVMDRFFQDFMCSYFLPLSIYEPTPSHFTLSEEGHPYRTQQLFSTFFPGNLTIVYHSKKGSRLRSWNEETWWGEKAQGISIRFSDLAEYGDLPARFKTLRGETHRVSTQIFVYLEPVDPRSVKLTSSLINFFEGAATRQIVVPTSSTQLIHRKDILSQVTTMYEQVRKGALSKEKLIDKLNEMLHSGTLHLEELWRLSSQLGIEISMTGDKKSVKDISIRFSEIVVP